MFASTIVLARMISNATVRVVLSPFGSTTSVTLETSILSPITFVANVLAAIIRTKSQGNVRSRFPTSVSSSNTTFSPSVRTSRSRKSVLPSKRLLDPLVIAT